MANAKPTRLAGPERREQILAVARKAFMASGLAGARVRDIADMAGCNEGTLYYYFRSKEELFEAAVLEPLEEMVAALGEATRRIASEEPGDWPKDFREGTRHVIRTLSEILPMLGLVLFSDQEQEQGRRFYKAHIHPVLSESMELLQGSLSKWSHASVDPVLGPAVFGMVWGVVMDHWLRKRKLDEDHIADVLTQFFFHGIPVPQPAKKAVRSRKASQ